MTSKTTFKGFTFKKKTAGQFVPPPPTNRTSDSKQGSSWQSSVPAQARQSSFTGRDQGSSVQTGNIQQQFSPSGETSSNATSGPGSSKKFSNPSCSASKSANVGGSSGNGSGSSQPSVRTFFNPPAARPIATVTPQGHGSTSSVSSTSGMSTGTSRLSNSVRAVPTPTEVSQQNSSSSTSASSSSMLKRKRKSEAAKSPQLSAVDLCDFDDDDDFDIPTLTPVTPKRSSAPLNKSKASDKENAGDSDDEILPVRKRRSMVLHSDDENDDEDLDDGVLAPTPPKPLRLSQTPRLTISQTPQLSQTPRLGQTPCRQPPPSASRLGTSNSGYRNTSSSQSSQPSDVSSSRDVQDQNQSAVKTLVRKGSTHSRTFPSSQSSPNSARAVQQNVHQPEITDVTKHPLLTSEVSTLNQEQLQEMQTLLLRVTDEVCELICSASTAALMNLGLPDYGRLQTLLAVRKQIKDKEAATTAASLSTNMNTTPAVNRYLPASHNSPAAPELRANFTTETPDQFRSPPPSSIASSSVKKVSVTSVQPVADSPVPCGDSFFEDVAAFTQSHMTYMRGFKTPTSGASPASNTLPPAALAQREGDSDPSVVRSRQTATDGERELFQPTGAPSFDDESFGDEEGDISFNHEEDFSDFPVENSEQSPIIILSQEDSVHEAGDCSYKGQVNPVPVMEESVFKKPGVPPHSSASNSDRCVAAMSDETFDNYIDDFLDDDEDFGEILPEIAEEDTQATSSEVTTADGISEPYVPIFGSTDKDDGATGEFDGEMFPHSQELRNLFHSVFGLREFRHNQLQALNAALLGHDCFILMPTGGGKSLCYQLPAIVSPGITVVISPLRALIQDQVQRLISFDIPAASLSGDLDASQANSVYSSLYQRQPGTKLLYVTPEKVSASDKLLSCLENLHRRQMLDRFIIDEAHCVSQWGHDFRPDYKKLNVLRSRFPGVPIMALTATATPRVRKDIIHQLAMTSPKWFMQSFNRPNLKYSVRPKKPSNATKDIIELIKSKFRNECGIVYCLSRKECDTVADTLRGAGVEASAYHAGLPDSERNSVQDRWLSGDHCKVICATIAFGMGIDKADVRFVIHYSLPKSVEGYYQEAGRAGRDGMIAHCILFYTYQDVKRLRRIIDMDKTTTYESRRTHIDNLFRMVQYCENLADCRRGQVLQYFGEHHFDRARCNIFAGAICDNCSSKDMFKLRDVTEDAKEVVKCVRELTSHPRNNFTLLHFVEIFKGSKNTRIMDMGHNQLALHGRGAAYSRGDAERLMHKLVVEGVVIEELKITAADTAACYVRIGPNAANLMNNKMKIEMAVQGGGKRSVSNRIGQEPQTNRQQIVETCYKELVAMAKTIATEHGSKNYALIFPNAMLWQLAEKTPVTVAEMKSNIDGLPETKINKYGAHRFLEITTKYRAQLSNLQDEVTADSQSDVQTTGDWASPYFDAGSTSSAGGKKNYGGRSRGGKSRGGKKSKGGWKKKSTSSKKAGPGSSQRGRGGSTSRGRGGAGARGGGSSRPSTSSGFDGGRKQQSSITKSSLGLMPDPRARSYLASIGSYMG